MILDANVFKKKLLQDCCVECLWNIPIYNIQCVISQRLLSSKPPCIKRNVAKLQISQHTLLRKNHLLPGGCRY